jgi:hypothetical protein
LLHVSGVKEARRLASQVQRARAGFVTFKTIRPAG